MWRVQQILRYVLMAVGLLCVTGSMVALDVSRQDGEDEADGSLLALVEPEIVRLSASSLNNFYSNDAGLSLVSRLFPADPDDTGAALARLTPLNQSAVETLATEEACGIDIERIEGTAGQWSGTAGQWSGTESALAVLAEGGVIMLPDGTPIMPSAPAADFELADFDEPVAILIVDDFGDQGTIGDLDDEFQIGIDFTDRIIAGENPFGDSMGLLQEQTEFGRQHGPLVLNHLVQLIQSTGQFSAPDRQGPSVTMEQLATGVPLRIQAVHVDNYSPASIVLNTTTAIANLYSDGFERLVYNLSFGLLPCGVFNDFNNAALADEERPDRVQNTSFELYVQRMRETNTLADLYSTGEIAEMAAAVCNSADRDVVATQCDALDTRSDAVIEAEIANIVLDTELFCLLTTPLPATDIVRSFINSRLGMTEYEVFIGASGNFNRPCPFYPARLPQVVSVSSYDQQSSAQSVFSNAGEDSALGAWFLLSDESDTYETVGTVRVVYAGSSFAAPSASLQTAAILSQDDWDLHAFSERHTYAAASNNGLRYYCDINFGDNPSPIPCPPTPAPPP